MGLFRVAVLLPCLPANLGPPIERILDDLGGGRLPHIEAQVSEHRRMHALVHPYTGNIFVESGPSSGEWDASNLVYTFHPIKTASDTRFLQLVKVNGTFPLPSGKGVVKASFDPNVATPTSISKEVSGVRNSGFVKGTEVEVSPRDNIPSSMDQRRTKRTAPAAATHEEGWIRSVFPAAESVSIRPTESSSYNVNLFLVGGDTWSGTLSTRSRRGRTFGTYKGSRHPSESARHAAGAFVVSHQGHLRLLRARPAQAREVRGKP